jgi:hypothetical protein
VIVVDLADLYKKWQRSTPFQCNSTNHYQMFVCDDMENVKDDNDLVHPGVAPMINKARSEQAKALEDDMDCEPQSLSPFSGPSISVLNTSSSSIHQKSQ